VLANITTNYFPPASINPGSARLVFMLAVVLLYFKKFKTPNKDLFIMIIAFLMYNLFLVLLNKDLLQPLINFVKVLVPMMMIFIGHSVIRTRIHLESLFRAYMVSLFIFILNYVLANIFGLGGSTYLEDSFYIGGSGVGSANELAIFMMIGIAFLLLNTEKKWTWITIILLSCASVIMLLSMRRGAIVTLVVSLVIYMFINGVNYRIMKYLVIALSIIFISLPFYVDSLVERYIYRVESRGGSLVNYEIESRFFECQEVPMSLSKENRWLIGTHNLNSSEYFGRRELHVGYMAILHGGGLIGLFLFIAIIIMLYKKGKAIYLRSKGTNKEKDKEGRLLFALYLSLISGILVYLLSSRLHGFGVTVPSFLMMGGILGYLHHLFLNKCISRRGLEHSFGVTVQRLRSVNFPR
jgi:hypothetical protein